MPGYWQLAGQVTGLLEVSQSDDRATGSKPVRWPGYCQQVSQMTGLLVVSRSDREGAPGTDHMILFQATTSGFSRSITCRTEREIY